MSVMPNLRNTATGQSYAYIDTPNFAYDQWLQYLNGGPIGSITGNPAIAIIGGGVSGLCAAYELSQSRAGGSHASTCARTSARCQHARVSTLSRSTSALAKGITTMSSSSWRRPILGQSASPPCSTIKTIPTRPSWTSIPMRDTSWRPIRETSCHPRLDRSGPVTRPLEFRATNNLAGVSKSC